MTKGELAQRILRIIGVNTRFTEADPIEVQDTLKYLEDFMTSENGVGRRIGWLFAENEPKQEDDSGLPEFAVMGITNSVAVMIAPYFDKKVHPSIQTSAARGMQTIAARTIEIQNVNYPARMPRGHANGSPYSKTFYQKQEYIRTDNDFLTDDEDEPITP